MWTEHPHGASGAHFPDCPTCGRPLQLTRNPYYGVGRAVHEWLYLCSTCPYSALAPEDTETAPDADSAPPVTRRRFRFRTRPHR